MRINVFIDEIEFEEGAEIEYNFHDQIRIKKAFERELSRLFLDTTNNNNRDFSILNIVNKNNKNIFTFKNSESINSLREIDGGEFSLFTGNRSPSSVGKSLAKSIYSSLSKSDG